MKNLNNANIKSFLNCGYFLDYSHNLHVPKFKTSPELLINKTEVELIEHGSIILQEVIQDLFQKTSKHIVPLSGGLDSRAIIAALLNMTSTENIETYTFGMPGSYDYELGQYIAKHFNIKNYAISFNDVQFNYDMLNDASSRFDHQTHLFYHPDYRIIEQRFSDYQYWSGFLGGESAGGHFYKFTRSNNNINDNKHYFLKKNKYSAYPLDKSDFKALIGLIDIPEFASHMSNISTYEIIDFYNRQTKYIAPHVLPKGFNHASPFATKKWLEFICSVPIKYRINCDLFEKILLNLYPEFFKLPTKNKLGYGLDVSEFKFFRTRLINKIRQKTYGNSKRKDLNYFDFNEFIREKSDVNRLVKDSLFQLEKSKRIDWLDIQKIYKSHMNKETNNGGIIQLLASLEINLRNNESLNLN